MGNRAVIINKADMHSGQINSEQIGIYLHRNGGRDSVEAFLTYCELRGFRTPDSGTYGRARLVQVIANYMGGKYSIGIGQVKDLDTDNFDNSVYIIEGWKIVGRMYQRGADKIKTLLDNDRRFKKE